MSPKKQISGTTLLHGDHDVELLDNMSVASPVSVTTTFKTPYEPKAFEPQNPARDGHLYARYTTGVSTRVEHILSKVNEGHAITYSSGLTAAYAALLLFAPKRVAITEGYMGVHAALNIYRQSNASVQVIDIDDEFKPGDLCWLETPLNPTSECRDIKYYADKVHRAGGRIVIDSTFAPPPLQYPFDFGADCIHHSGTKYFGGHSDLLCGILVVKTEDEWKTLWHNRTYLGNMMGSFESWLLLRSLKTFHLRVTEQIKNAAQLVAWLNKVAQTPSGKTFDGAPGGVIEKVFHSSLQGKDSRGFEPSQQMKGGFPATFSIRVAKVEYAAELPFLLQYYTPATSLGGVETLIEWRVRSDPASDPLLVRISVGVENFEDLRDDMRRGLNLVLQKIKTKL